MPNSAVLLQSELHDHAPNGQIAKATALDTAIMALTPWSYWKLATDPYDTSGNARHGYTSLVPVWSQPAITPKCGLCVQLANSQIHFPTPQSKLGAASGTFTFMGMVKFIETTASGSPVGDRYRGATFFFQGEPANPQFDMKLGFQDLPDGGSLIVQSGLSPTGGYVGRQQLNKPMVIAFVGTSLPFLIYTFDVWVNGVKLVSGYPRYASSGGVAGWVTLGRMANTERLANFQASNWACWNRELLAQDIMDLTECYMDKATYAGAWKPRVAP